MLKIQESAFDFAEKVLDTTKSDDNSVIVYYYTKTGMCDINFYYSQEKEHGNARVVKERIESVFEKIQANEKRLIGFNLEKGNRVIQLCLLDEQD